MIGRASPRLATGVPHRGSRRLSPSRSGVTLTLSQTRSEGDKEATVTISETSEKTLDELVTPKADRVSADVFRSRDVFDREMERIFGRSWVYVAHESEIPNEGDFKTTTIGTQPIIVTRSKAGPHAFLNRCRHRAAVVCTSLEGNTRNFQCPYHGWTYGVDGTLVGVPWRHRQSSEFERADWGLNQVAHLDTYRGFIFVTLDPHAVPLRQHLGRAADFIDLYLELSPTGQIAATAGRHEYQIRANWKQPIENAVDGYHPTFAHQSYFDLVKERMGGGVNTVKMFGYDGSGATYARYLGNGHSLLDLRGVDRSRMIGTSFPNQEAEGRLRAALEERLGPERAGEILSYRGGDGFNLVVYPNMMLVNNQIRVVEPKAPDLTYVYAYPTLLEDVADELNESRLRSHEDFFGPAGLGAPDDWAMLERQWEGMQALGASTSHDWLLYERGIDDEHVEEGDVVGHFTDEVPQRGMWQRWRELMA